MSGPRANHQSKEMDVEHLFFYAVRIEGKVGQRLYPTRDEADAVRRRVIEDYVDAVESDVLELHMPARLLSHARNTPAVEVPDTYAPPRRERDERDLSEVIRSAWASWEAKHARF